MEGDVRRKSLSDCVNAPGVSGKLLVFHEQLQFKDILQAAGAVASRRLVGSG
jgi:hypothetical protein